ncbi:voltage-dependent calcium channel type A subunit alpha-1-like [Lycorma delicatula]|uniref:voltage-dependent calcium channel type A subunit alpha-1-like n=1 Tax=Lycorma delicatula TaxID=130591 RepID=UPI003F5179AE
MLGNNYEGRYDDVLLEQNHIQLCGKKIPWNWKLFDYFTLLIIVLSNLNLVDRVSVDKENHRLDFDLFPMQLTADFIYLLLLFIEVIIRITASGFISGKNAYLKNFFNAIDLIVLFGWFLTFFPFITFYYWRTLRTLKIIYVFRHCQGINSIWKTISNAFFPLTVVGVVIFLILLYAATFCFHTYLHSTMFQICFNEADVSHFYEEYHDDFDVCVRPGKIGNFLCLANTSSCDFLANEIHIDFITFSSIWKTVFIVFQIATLEGWSSIVYAFANAKSSIVHWWYFIIIVIVGGIFGLNLIIGVIAVEYKRVNYKNTGKTAINYPKNFNKLHRKSDTDKAFHHENVVDQVSDNFSVQPHIDFRTSHYTYAYDSWSYLKNLVEDYRFSNAVSALICINTLILCIKTNEQSEGVTEFLRYAETIFLTLFLIEVVIKIAALRSQFFTNALMCFDLLIVIASCISFFWFHNSFGLTAFRALHLLNLLNSTRYSKMYFSFINLLGNSVEQLLTLLLISSIFLVIYAAFGIHLYSYEKLNEYDNSTIHAPYRTFQNALIHTFQVMSGESWTHIMFEAVTETGKQYFDEIYFISAVVLGKYILLNILLVIGVDIMTTVYYYKDTDESQIAHTVEIDLSGNREDDSGNRASGIEVPNIQGANNDIDGNASCRTPFLPYNTLYIFSRTNWLRKTAHYVVNLHYFDLFIMIILLIDAFYQLLSETSVWFLYLVSEAIFVGIYLTEMSMKVIDIGFVMHPGSYLRNPWNVIDFIMLCTAFILFYIKYNTLRINNEMGLLKGLLRSIRTVRLFRFLTLSRKYFPKLQRSCDSIIKAFKYFPFLLIFYGTLLLIFSIVGLHIFNGRINFCREWAVTNLSYCSPFEPYIDYNNSHFLHINETYELHSRVFHFNNIFRSTLTLFAVHSGQEWSKIMDFITDFSDRTNPLNGTDPIHIPLTIFFVIYLILFSFIFVKLFMALVITTYCEVRNSKLKKNGLDKNQEDCINYVLTHSPLKKYIPISNIGIRRKAWDIVMSSNFKNFITFVIILNALSFTLNTKQAQVGLFYIIVNMIFSLIYIVECILKITAFKCINFLKSSWNILDFCVALSGLLDIVFCIPNFGGLLKGDEDIMHQIMVLAFDTNLLKTLHLLKFFRFIKHTYVKRILWACKKSFQALPSTLFPIGLLFIIYGTIGKEVKSNFPGYYMSPDSYTVNDYFNFITMGTTMMLLLRTATGEYWLWTMNDITNLEIFNRSIINQYLTVIFYHAYFISFVFLSTYMFLNLVPAMIVDNFSNLLLNESVLGEHHLDEFRSNWTEYDPKATRKIHYKEFFEMLKKIPPPLGFGSNCPKDVAHKKLMRLNIPVGEDGKIGFKVSLFALIRDNLNIRTGNFTISERKKIDEELRDTLKKLWPHINIDEFNLMIPNISDKQLTIGKMYAGRLILDYWRRHHTVPLD